MEFFHLIKATQKSGKEDAVIWFTAKSEARANLQLDVELEDAGIETGRGKDYSKPVRTDFPVYNDLPEESTVDYTGANATNCRTMDAPGCQRLVLSLLEPWTTTLPLRKRPLQLKPPSRVSRLKTALQQYVLPFT
jgi:exodeoxyribonuclease VIII